MKVLIFGPKARYDAYLPSFVQTLPLEPVFCQLDQSPLQAAEENPDAEILFADPIVEVTEDLLDKLPRLRLIQSEGVAYNRFDLEAARARGIPVCNNKGCNAASVAEHTVMLMLMALRHGITGHQAVREGRQIQMKEAVMASRAPELGEQSVGLIGLGDIGQATAWLLQPFGCTLHYYSAHRRPPETEAALGVSYQPLEELAATNTILSLHCAVTPETTHIIHAGLLSCVQPGTLLVNTARGQLVDNQAVRQALLDGRLGGIAFDTFDPEPTSAAHPLVALPPEIQDRAVYSPHLGGNTGGSFQRAHTNMWRNAQHILAGERPLHIVNNL